MHYSENLSQNKQKTNLNEEIQFCTLAHIADGDFYIPYVVQWQQCLSGIQLSQQPAQKLLIWNELRMLHAVTKMFPTQ